MDTDFFSRQFLRINTLLLRGVNESQTGTRTKIEMHPAKGEGPVCFSWQCETMITLILNSAAGMAAKRHKRRKSKRHKVCKATGR